MVGGGKHIGCICRVKVVAMQEIGFALFQHSVARRCDVIPAHMRNFDVGRGRNRSHGATNPPESLRRAMLITRIGQQLHAHANAEKWLAIMAHCQFHRADHAVNCQQGFNAVRKGSDAGQYDPVGVDDNFGIGGDNDIRRTRRLERVTDGLKIACAIVDQRDSHFTASPWSREWRRPCAGQSRPLGAVRGRVLCSSFQRYDDYCCRTDFRYGA